MIEPFEPAYGQTLTIANSAAARAVASVPDSVSVVALYNSSTTAMAYFVCQQGAGRLATAADMPIPPGQFIRITVPSGHKSFSVIASAADGNLTVAFGQGN